jgi:hypothetical protein
MIDTFEFDGGREVTVYIPDKPPEAIVFAGDGQRIAEWGRCLEKAAVRSTMVVGVTAWPMRHCAFMSTRRALTPSGSQHMKRSSSKMYFDGRGRTSA